MGNQGLWNKTTALAAVLAVSLAAHFAFFGNPASVVFDEVHFGKFVSGYSTGEYYFDIHPPLGKLLIAGFAAPFGVHGLDPQATIDSPIAGNGYMALRFLPTVSGVLIPVVVSLLLLELGLGLVPAFFGGLLLCFDNALLVQTRSIFLDGFLLLFLLSALLYYLRYRTSGSWGDLLACALAAGASASIKWTGLAALGLILIWETHDALKVPGKQRALFLVRRSGAILAAAFVLYFAVFAVHFALLPKSGPGDAFMTPEFQKTLEGNPNQKVPTLADENIFQKFGELNVRMYTANRDLTDSHPYSSLWYTWPVEVRPIYYWVKDDSRIYLVGNPALWWSAALGVAILAGMLFSQRWTHRRTTTFLLGAWVLNYLPFIFIGRVMFLYHYLAAWIFSVLILVYLLSLTKRPVLWYSLLTGAVVLLFLWFAPLTYGLPLDAESLKLRQWFQTWI